MKKMMVDADVTENGKVTCHISLTRTDIIANCDVAEDLCIARGYNTIDFVLPPSMTIGGETELN
jgi:phenylalanyl-tRNA synthetase beta chain